VEDLVAGDRNGSVIVWELASGEQVFMQQVEGTISQVAFSPDGNYIAAASEQHREFDWAMPLERGLHVWNLESGEAVPGFPDLRAQAVAISPNSRLLAAGDFFGKVHIWDLETQTEQHSLTAHDGAVLALQFSPDGNELASNFRFRYRRTDADS
jgi:WD40 repeat protein